MKKTFCIFLCLILVFSSFALAFAKTIPPEENAPVGGNWITDGNGNSTYLTLNEATSIVSYHKTYMSAYGDTWQIGFPSNAPDGSVRWAYTFKVEFTNQTSGQNGIAIGNQAVSGSTSYLPVCTFDVGDYVEGNTFTLDWQNYPRLIVKDGYGQFTLLFDAPASNPYWNLYINPNTTTLGWLDIDLTLLSVVGDGVVYYGEDTSPDLTVDTYAFTVPYGSNVKFTAERIDQIYVRYDTGDRKVGSYLGSSIPTAKYSYDGTPNTLTALQSALSMPLKGYGKRNLIGAYSTFECYLLPNGKQINVFNPLNPDSDSVAYGDMYVNITTLGAPKAVYYSPNGSVQIINGSSDAVNDEGNSSTIGGSGTADDPFIQTPTYNDGTTVNLDNISFGDNTNNDGVIANFVAVIQSIFSIPSSIVSNLGQWVSGLGDVVSSLFGAMPPQITSMVVTFFSAVLLIGIIKMFL